MGMKLRCLEGCSTSATSSYSLLPSISEYESKDSNQNEKQECLCFYNDDGSYQEVVVEERLRADDLCQLLSVKNRVNKDSLWTIVESWEEYGMERIVEDHEEVLRVYRQTSGSNKKFIFRKCPNKYEFPVWSEDGREGGETVDFSRVWDNERAPSPENADAYVEKSWGLPAFTRFWYMDPHKNYWVPTYLFLRGRKVYMSSRIEVVAKFVRQLRHRHKYSELDESDQNLLYGRGRDWDCVEPVADLATVDVYRVLNAKRHLSSPTEFGLTLRPSDSEDFSTSLCLSAHTSTDLENWIAAMRLAKYGKQLRENYRTFKNKQNEQNSTKDYNRHSVPNESVRSRVAMDFTGSVGRIVEDPTEAKAIALAEGLAWKKRYRTNNASIQRGGGCEAEMLKQQPWFHKTLSRHDAANLISNSSNQDGVFLVRESRSNPGTFVLTFKCSSKVIHMPVTPMLDVVRDTLCYTLDNGVTKFYDILQLVEFYQLNAGCLPTRLTYYLCLQ